MPWVGLALIVTVEGPAVLLQRSRVGIMSVMGVLNSVVTAELVRGGGGRLVKTEMGRAALLGGQLLALMNQLIESEPTKFRLGT